MNIKDVERNLRIFEPLSSSGPLLAETKIFEILNREDFTPFRRRIQINLNLHHVKT